LGQTKLPLSIEDVAMSRLINIQILRFVAAMAVVFYHSGVEATYVCEALGQGCGFDFWGGGYGVALFFMISGFIMIVTSWNSFGQSGAVGDFLRRRITRIVPLYWFVTSLAVIGILIMPSMLKVNVLDLPYIMSSYLFWPVARENGLVRPIAALGWTLNLEMFFYGVFALSLLFARARGLLVVLASLTLFSLLHATGLFSAGGALAAVPLHFWSDPIILNFVLGMGVGIAYMNGMRLGWLGAAAFACASLLVVGAEILLVADSFWLRPEDEVLRRLSHTLPGILFFAGAALGPQINAQSLAARAGMLIGDASYSLYLIHPFILRPLQKIWVKLIGDALPEWMFVPVCIVAALAGGIAVYVIVERPMTRYFSRKPAPHAAHPAFAAPGVQPGR
jgi:exopolysaccharide production protein ExoZ